MSAIRAFLAIPLPEKIVQKAQEVQVELGSNLTGIRWVKPAAMHLTLKFFGAISEEDLEKIGQVMLSVGDSHPPFQVHISGLGVFPSPTRAKVFWLGVHGDPFLSALYSAFDQELQNSGFPAEARPFRPHLTLGRSRYGLSLQRSVLEHYRDADCGSLQADRVILFQSLLRPEGAVHRPLKTVPLGGNREPKK